LAGTALLVVLAVVLGATVPADAPLSRSPWLSRVVGGVETVLAQTAVLNPVVNVPFRLRASAVGTTLTLSLVGGKSISVSDSAHGGGTLGLLLAWQTTATPVYRADNFTACSGPPGTDCSATR
jgi:hypothetical protein